MKPAIPITDPRFVYTHSTHTDLRKSFARIRKEAEKAKPQTHVVIDLKRKP
jgi:hypothetical protein